MASSRMPTRTSPHRSIPAPQSAQVTRLSSVEWSGTWRHRAGGGRGGTPPVGSSRQVIPFGSERFCEIVSHWKTTSYGGHFSGFGGETVHTFSTQFPAKPLSTKTLV